MCTRNGSTHQRYLTSKSCCQVAGRSAQNRMHRGMSIAQHASGWLGSSLQKSGVQSLHHVIHGGSLCFLDMSSLSKNKEVLLSLVPQVQGPNIYCTSSTGAQYLQNRSVCIMLYDYIAIQAKNQDRDQQSCQLGNPPTVFVPMEILKGVQNQKHPESNAWGAIVTSKHQSAKVNQKNIAFKLLKASPPIKQFT